MQWTNNKLIEGINNYAQAAHSREIEEQVRAENEEYQYRVADEH